MPKLKTKSGAKKRFKLTASGLLKHGVAGKRHRLISHNSKYIRQNRGTKVLSKADVLKAQTERLLKHPRAKRFVESFTGQWLELRKIHDMKPDAMYVEYDDWLAWSMPEETRAFFEEVLTHDLPTSSFLHSGWTMLNERLAKHYGIARDTTRGLDLRLAPLHGFFFARNQSHPRKSKACRSTHGTWLAWKPESKPVVRLGPRHETSWATSTPWSSR